MIIGVVHRMQLPRREPKALKYTKAKPSTGQQRRKLRIEEINQPVKTKVETKPLPKPRKADKDRIGPTLAQLKPGCCRWPVGVNAKGEQMFCGEAALYKAGNTDGKRPYCAEHMAVSQSKVTPEQREKQAEAAKKRFRANNPFKRRAA